MVVPYNQQRDATDAALQDGGFSQGTVPVGTSHAFQGRQFDTVLVDLVEDGRGWIATANRNGNDYDFDGLRLFNVAVTRAKNRLYVLVTGRALSQARQGPLASLKEMVRSGAARSVDAGGLLGLSGSERPVSGTPEADLLAALDPYVRVDGIHDEDAAIEAAITQIQLAEQSVWCWSAWVANMPPASSMPSRMLTREVSTSMSSPVRRTRCRPAIVTHWPICAPAYRMWC